jgi:hypothetical protein
MHCQITNSIDQFDFLSIFADPLFTIERVFKCNRLCLHVYPLLTGTPVMESNHHPDVRSIISYPLNERGIVLVLPPRFEQGSTDFQSVAMTTSAKGA